MVNIQILYEVGCPNYIRACDMVCRVISKYNQFANISIREVNENDTKFYGSPTLLIENIDVENCFNKQDQLNQSQYNACRIYQCKEHIGCPSIEMIECVLAELNLI